MPIFIDFHKVELIPASVSNSNSVLGIVSHSFYLEYRQGVCFPRKTRKDPIPKFHSMDDWQNAKSTKFDVCAKLVSHLLQHDDAPEIEVHDGKVTFPKIPREFQRNPKQDTKILIYQEFPSLGPLLRNVSTLLVVIDAGNLYFIRSSTFTVSNTSISMAIFHLTSEPKSFTNSVTTPKSVFSYFPVLGLSASI